jgi:hypothetical protein
MVFATVPFMISETVINFKKGLDFPAGAAQLSGLVRDGHPTVTAGRNRVCS